MMFASLKDVVPNNGKGGLASAGSLFPLEEVTRITPESVTDVVTRFPNLPLKVICTLAILSMCDGSFSPRKVCACGCGATVIGKARLKSAACRKREQRRRDKIKTPHSRQFEMPLQDEMPIKSLSVAKMTGQVTDEPFSASPPTPKTFAEKMVMLSQSLQDSICDAGMSRGDGIAYVKKMAPENDLADWPDTKTTDDYIALIYKFRNF